jgi:tripartite-type tricarboxylate transporter receptor subunit TctC
LTNGVKGALETPEAKKQADAQGVEIHYLNPPAVASLVTGELDYWNKVIKKANITLD